MEKPYKLRFRHLDGDVGPLTFQDSATVLAMKHNIWEEWPTDGPLSSKKPETVHHLRVMYQGKILVDSQSLADLKQLPGEILPDRLVTLHLVVAPPGQHTGSTTRRKSNEQGEQSCCCLQ